MWRARPIILLRLLCGLLVFGIGEGSIVTAGLGNSPWTVFAEGVAVNSSLGVGTATIAISFAVLLLWIPLRQLPGLGTLANAVVIGLAISMTLALLPDDPALGLRWALMVGGIALVAIGSGLYLTAALGPGPRDGLMTGLNRRFGVSLRLARTSVEASVLVAGFLLAARSGWERSPSRC